MKNTFIVGSIALVVGLGLGFVLSGRSEVRADDRGDAARDLIAVTGTVGSGTSVLWLIDTKDRRLSVYKSEGGKNVVWVASRNFTYDFKVDAYRDESDFSSSKLKKEWMSWDKKNGPDGMPATDRKSGLGYQPADDSGKEDGSDK